MAAAATATTRARVARLRAEIVPEIVRQMNEISEKQKRELERSESLRQRSRARTPPALLRRSKSKSPVNVRDVSPVRYARRSASPEAIVTLQAVNESLRKTAEHLSASNEKLHRLTPERISPPRTAPVVLEPINMPSAVNTAHWYRPRMSRDSAIDFLKDKQPGTFIVRDSTSYPGAYGLAMKVPDRGEHKTPEECVRHFLIEPAPGGVRVRGSDIEPVFSSLNALVYQHSLVPLSLPYRLLLTDGVAVEPKSADNLLRSLAGVVPDAGKGVAFMVLYLGCHEIGMLTGPHAIKNGFDNLFAKSRKQSITTVAVVMKVNADGITLTDHERRLFFRMHFPMKNFRYCEMDPGHRHWEYRDEVSGDSRSPGCFGIVSTSPTEPLVNECHMFAEFEQPASLLVEEINKWSARAV